MSFQMHTKNQRFFGATKGWPLQPALEHYMFSLELLRGLHSHNILCLDVIVSIIHLLVFRKEIMMKIQTGIDIIEVKRIQEAIERQGDKFLERVYTKQEIAYCKNTGKMQYQHYAARFAAKEAIFKAISSELPKNIGDIWTKIEIQNEKDGKPIANLEQLNLKNIESMDLSISHLKEYAVASFSIIFD